MKRYDNSENIEEHLSARGDRHGTVPACHGRFFPAAPSLRPPAQIAPSIANDCINAAVTTPHIVVIHETDGRKYLEALDALVRCGTIGSVSYHGSSVLWRFAHAVLRERRPVREALGIALANLRFRLRLAALRDKTVIIGIAPWDYRLSLLVWLLRRNRIIYNTSWPWWDGDRVPRRYGLLTSLMRWSFRCALRRPGVRVVAVTAAAADAVAACLPGVVPHVIPHVVSDVFFSRRARYGRRIRLLFIGELAEKKGFGEFAALVSQSGKAVEAAIIGDGPQRALAEALAHRPGCIWYGKVTDRARLADIIAGCQILLSLAKKTPYWEELFGMAILEAMAVGLPCIVSDHVGPRSIIHHGHDGFLVADGDMAAVRGWIQALQEQPALWRSVSAAAVETARRQYPMEVVSRRWRAVLTGEPGLGERVPMEPLLAEPQPWGMSGPTRIPEIGT